MAMIGFSYGYCDAKSECLASATSRKLGSFPPHFGSATLSGSVTNPALLMQAEALVKAIPHARATGGSR
jgi:D-aspartate ligase